MKKQTKSKSKLNILMKNQTKKRAKKRKKQTKKKIEKQNKQTNKQRKEWNYFFLQAVPFDNDGPDYTGQAF